MKRLIGVCAILLLHQSVAWATWSVVAVDRNTGRVVIASSTCAATASPENLKQLQAVVIPGVGVAACQAELVRCAGESHGEFATGKPAHNVDRIDRVIAWFDKYARQPKQPTN